MATARRACRGSRKRGWDRAARPGTSRAPPPPRGLPATPRTAAACKATNDQAAQAAPSSKRGRATVYPAAGQCSAALRAHPALLPWARARRSWASRTPQGSAAKVSSARASSPTRALQRRHRRGAVPKRRTWSAARAAKLRSARWRATRHRRKASSRRHSKTRAIGPHSGSQQRREQAPQPSEVMRQLPRPDSHLARRRWQPQPWLACSARQGVTVARRHERSRGGTAARRGRRRAQMKAAPSRAETRASVS